MSDFYQVGDDVCVKGFWDDDPKWIRGKVAAINHNGAGFWYEVDCGNGHEMWAVPDKMKRGDEYNPRSTEDEDDD